MTFWSTSELFSTETLVLSLQSLQTIFATIQKHQSELKWWIKTVLNECGS